MMRILMLTRGSGGDVFPFLQIGKVLKERGHLVTILTNSIFEGIVREAGLDYAAVDNSDTPGERVQKQRLPDMLDAGSQPLILDTLRTYELIKEHSRSQRTILVSHYCLQFTAQMVADKLGIKYVPVFASPYFIMTAPTVRSIYEATGKKINQGRGQFGLPPVHDWHAWLSAPGRGIGLWPDWFAPATPDWMLEVQPVGFIWNEKVEQGVIPPDVQEFIDGGAPPVLITHGTSLPAKPEFFSASIAACRRLGRRGIIVTPHAELVAGMLGEDMSLHRQLPFATLMPHMGAIIHHGGVGTSGQAMSSGTPQLILAFSYDRPNNAARLQHLGVGEYLSPLRWQPETIAASLSRLLTSPDVRKRCREVSARMNQNNPAEAACEFIESFISRQNPMALGLGA
jgi:rhamnosyltransferase subunit B